MSAVRAGVRITHRDQLPRSSRYELLVKIASGGMATVYVGRLSSTIGASRLVAIKRAHAHLLEDPAFAKMLIAEARLATRIHHPNVVAVQNVEEIEGELLLVMDYVEGASLADLMQFEERPLPARVAVRALLDACAGLHAAHELVDDDGRPLGIVHRDVSPHNILLGIEGIARLTDFGIAKSSNHTASGGRTTTGALKGKVSYMAPEYIESATLDVRSDVFALGIVAWETLTRRRLFRGPTEVESLKLVLLTEVPRPSEVAPWLGPALDEVILKALARSPAARFATAAELAEALETAARQSDLIAKHTDVAAFVRAAAGEGLEHRRGLIRERHADAVPTLDEAIEPVRIGRSEGTASFEIRARESVTAPFPSSRALSLGPEAQAPDQFTLGSGVSAGIVERARGSSSRGRRLVALAVASSLALVGGGFVLRQVTRADTRGSGAEIGQASGETPGESTLASPARVEASPEAPAPAPAPAPSAVVSVTAVTTPPAAELAAAATPRAVHRAGAPLRAPSRSTTPSRRATAIPTPYDAPQPGPEKSVDRAPPNPYGR